MLLMGLWAHISLHRKRQFMLLLVLMMLTSLVEIFSIGAVLPFLGALIDPEKVWEMAILQPLINMLELDNPKQLLAPLTLGFGAAALTAGLMRLILLWLTTRLSFSAGADLSIDIYRRTLYQNYQVHCSRNSSQVIDGILGKVNSIIHSIIFPSLTFISSSIILLAILITLILIEPWVALFSFGGFGLIYFLIILLARKQVKKDSLSMARESPLVVKSLQEGLGGIRDVLVDGNQEVYCEIYRSADSPLRRAQGNIAFISAAPRFGMEALGMILIAALAYWLARQPDGITFAVPILGALALGAQRLLPVLQQVYSSWTQINSGRVSLEDALALLDQKMPDYLKKPRINLLFSKCINLKDVSFRYGDETPYVIRNINLNIAKGSRVGFIGSTGSGKSTLIDIIMGLLQPSEGILKIDDEIINLENVHEWQSYLAHVPQSIFLADSTIAENIAFGIPYYKIDHERVRYAAQQAQISESIEEWPLKYKTNVGERGVRLSGGQRQRIGIARALYKKAEVIIFDEATSSLDNETEKSVMRAIEELNSELTLLIIAHRLTTLKKCSLIVELGEGGVKRVGSYQEMLNHSKTHDNF